MNDIAEAANYSKATLYVYFKNKEEIENALVLKAMETLLEEIRGALACDNGWIRTYYAICNRIAAFYDENPLAYEAAAGHIDVRLEEPGFPKILHDIYDTGEEINSLLHTFLERGVGEKLVRPELPLYETVFILWSSLTGIVKMAAQKEEYLRRRFHTGKMDFLHHGFKLLLHSILLPQAWHAATCGKGGGAR